ncbi:MAG: hypothetical protein ACFFFT_10210 [Candidatus Thorarchaeota archaeon]
MVQVLIKKNELEKPFVLEDVIILEELPAIEGDYEVIKVKAAEKPVKKALLKLMKKAKYNAKYLEEKISIEKIRKNIYYRNYGNY